MHAFAPTISHAMMATSGKSLVEICTARGFKLVEVDVAGDSKNSEPGIKFTHECTACAACAAIGAPPSPPSTMFTFAPILAGSSIIAVGTSSFAFANVLYLSAPPTGPPAL
ncbi:MAG: hypothetical protein HC782_01740 [Gammaproteobacteria bacterium]|nr:hypothetical protein [Gammaproteobacteria bacterium]